MNGVKACLLAGFFDAGSIIKIVCKVQPLVFYIPRNVLFLYDIIPKKRNSA